MSLVARLQFSVLSLAYGITEVTEMSSKLWYRQAVWSFRVLGHVFSLRHGHEPWPQLHCGWCFPLPFLQSTGNRKQIESWGDSWLLGLWAFQSLELLLCFGFSAGPAFSFVFASFLYFLSQVSFSHSFKITKTRFLLPSLLLPPFPQYFSLFLADLT